MVSESKITRQISRHNLMGRCHQRVPTHDTSILQDLFFVNGRHNITVQEDHIPRNCWGIFIWATNQLGDGRLGDHLVCYIIEGYKK